MATLKELLQQTGTEKFKSEDILLPATLEDAQKLLKENGPQYVKEVYPYIKTSLAYGRPLNQTIICVVGDDDWEKRTTLSSLFQDCDISPKNSSIFVAEEISIVNKPLKVESASKPVVGFLSFVMVPGSKNDPEVETRHLNDLKKFRESPQFERSMSDCTNYKGLLGRSGLSIRRSAFPNLVLFFTSALRNTSDKSLSDIETSLRSLLTTNIVDAKYPNLIVVVTNAEELGLTKHDFLVATKEQNSIIQKFVTEIFKINHVPIIYIQNRNEMQIQNYATGYQILPDGQFSHKNLLEAMQTIFNGQNGHFEDVLGKAFIGIYSQSDYNNLQVEENDETDLKMTKINYGRSINAGNDLQFLNLGKGICPLSGEIKFTSLLSPGYAQAIEINSRTFRIPPNVSAFTEIQTNIFSRDTVSVNEKNNETSYATTFSSTILGLEVVSWNMPVSQKINESSSSEYCTMYFVLEKQIAVFKLEDPQQILNCLRFREHFNTLNGRYFEQDKKVIYDNFFDAWGTHFITQQGVGGAMYVRVEIKKSELKDEISKKIATQLKFAFGTNIGGVGAEYKNIAKELNSFGFKNEEIKILGGTDQPTISSFEDLKPEMFKIWNETLMIAPANLATNRKIMPYHQLIIKDMEMLNNMKEAAGEYLKGRSKQFAQVNSEMDINASQFEKLAIN